MRRLSSLLTFCCIAMVADIALADPIFTWRDAKGGVHYSNRHEVIPSEASEVELPPLPVHILSRKTGLPSDVARAVSMAPPGTRHPRSIATCDAPDPSGVAAAVAERLGQRQLDGLTVIVAGVPIAYSDSANIQVKGPDAESGTASPAAQAALAYPRARAARADVRRWSAIQWRRRRVARVASVRTIVVPSPRLVSR